MTAQSAIYRREFYRNKDITKSFQDFEAEPNFAKENFIDFFGKTWLPSHPDAFSLDNVLKSFYDDSLDESKGIFFRVFAVSDGSLVQHIEENEPWLKQGLRFITLVAGNEQAADAQPFQIGSWTLCIVGSSAVTSRNAFLQVASWDGTRFRYYGRQHINDPLETGKTPSHWIFQGDSTQAFGEQSYLGPFNGHVNGSLVMKELHRPWVHWLVAGNGFINRMSPTFLKTFNVFPYLSDSDVSTAQPPANASGILSKVSGADELEHNILAGINKWYSSRRQMDFIDNNQPRSEVHNIKRWLAHILLTTTINITAATVNQSGIKPGRNFDIPISNFYNVDVFGGTAAAGVKPTISLSNTLTFDEKSYGAAIDRLGLALVSPCPEEGQPQPDYSKHPKVGSVPTFGGSDEMFLIQPGEGQDTFFVTLQPSYEDTQAISILLTMKTPLLSKNCIYAMLMVDPYNPIYSWRRGVLMQYVPDMTKLSGPYNPKNPTLQTYDLESTIEAAVRASPRFKSDPDSPESEFITNLESQRNTQTSADTDHSFATTMNSYLTETTDRLRTNPSEALLDYLTLTESRRRVYRPVPLDEFALTLPWAVNYKYDRPFEMTKDGTISPVPDRGKEFFEQWIGSLASWDPQMMPKPDANASSNGNGKINGGGMNAVFSLEEPAVLNIGCQAAGMPAYRLGGGCPFNSRRTKRQREGQ